MVVSCYYGRTVAIREGFTMPPTFGAKLKELRAAAGLSQQQLAMAAGLSVSFIAKLEQGGSDPSWTTVQALAKPLGVSCEAFGDEMAAKPAAKRKGK
jgi:transcriptional regulator with XRE-family HTH domain